jgi:hypothetical protein
MHLRNPRRSIPSWLWSSKIVSAIFQRHIPPIPSEQASFWLSPCRTGGHTVLFHANLFWRCGNNPIVRWFTLVCVSEERSLSGSFEELAMPLFERLYNFAHWLTQDRQEAEDLVQETYAKALKGFGSFRPAPTSAPGSTRFFVTRSSRLAAG